jgi:hypothetical protein
VTQRGPVLAHLRVMTNIAFRDGPRHGTTEPSDDRLPVVIGDGSDGGVYHLTDAVEESSRIYVWQPLTDAEVDALVRGDLRANQD